MPEERRAERIPLAIAAFRRIVFGDLFRVFNPLGEFLVGQKTPLRLARGLNATWKNGGLMYAMPVR